MKKFILTVLALTFSPTLWAFSLSELAQVLQKPQHIQGQFTQQRQLKSLSKPMTTSGQFVLLPQKGLLWQMQKPFTNTIRVRADGIKQWNGQTWVSPNKSAQTQQVQLFLDLLAGNTQNLEKQFHLALSGSTNQWTLRLTPKTILMKQIFTQINITGDNMVRKIELQEKQGDTTTMQFSQLDTSKPLNTFANTHLAK